MNYPLIHRAVEPSKIAKRSRVALDAALADGDYVLQPKYDGVNGVLDVYDEGIELRTRTGELVPSCAHIEQAAARLPHGRYFGEIWATQRKHTEINGAARQHAPAPWLNFVAFDHITPQEVAVGLSLRQYHARFDILSDALDDDGSICITEVLSEPGTSATLEYLQGLTPAILAELRGRGGAYDGLICRPVNYCLELGHSGNDGAIIKLKPRATADLLVVGTYPGKGKHEGRMGGVIVSLDGTPTGPTCEVGTGFSDAERERCIVTDPWPGKTIEVTYLELTKAGKLREPAYQSVRFDKNKPDNLLEQS